MPQQLIYTSAPRGIVAGRSGHCTVARSAAMREALMLQLEKLSYYQHLSLAGGRERPIYACRVVEIRGARYHVLSRIQDAGLDFTGRTNFLAHHVVFTPEEIRQLPSPPIILAQWGSWVTSWSKEPQLLENEDWSGLEELSGTVSLPAANWQQVTGDAVNGYGLLESRSGNTFRVDGLADEQILALFTETLELLELRDPRRDFRASAWQYTFTTSMQEQDNPADFRWRCLHSDNPASARFAGPNARLLSEVRAERVTAEEAVLARSGRQAPRFVVQPQNVFAREGETARLVAKAEGVPAPSYQWFAVDRAGSGQIIASANQAELIVQNPPIGVSRYVARASNSQGDATSEVATLSTERKAALAQSPPFGMAASSAKLAQAAYVKSAEVIDNHRTRLRLEKAQEAYEKRQRRHRLMLLVFVFILSGGVITFAFQRFLLGKSTTYPPPLVRDMAAPPPNSSSSQPPDTTPRSAEAPAAGQSIDATKILSATEKPLLYDSFVGLSSAWSSTVIGSFDGKTNATKTGGTFILTGGGADINGKSDHFFYVYHHVTNFSDFSAEIQRVSNGTILSRCGIMLRQSERPDAPFLFVGVSSISAFCIHRPRLGDTSKQAVVRIQSPRVSIKLSRIGAVFIAEYSAGGGHWTPLETNTIPTLSQGTQLIGFALRSGYADKTVTVDFGNIGPSPSP